MSNPGAGFGFSGKRAEGRSVAANEGSRCVSEGLHGRCQLRGSTGAVGENPRLKCAWHAHADHRPGSEKTFKAFCDWLRELKERGSFAYTSRTAAEWWDLIQGKAGPGGFTNATGEDMEKAQAKRSRENFEKEMKDNPHWYLKGLDIWEKKDEIGKIPQGEVAG